MKKPTQVSNAIIAKCCDGAFRRIELVEPTKIDGDTANAKANYGQKGSVYGWYRINDNDQAVFTTDLT